jgi:PIN domain nuclease of toxin-antitoxin system
VIVLDTHAWVWWVASPDKLSVKARRAVAGARTRAVCAISVWEVAMLVERERLTLDRDVLMWIEQSLAEPGIELLPLSPTIAVRSTRLGRHFHGDPADRIVVATALERRCPLVTKDERIRRYGEVTAVW